MGNICLSFFCWVHGNIWILIGSVLAYTIKKNLILNVVYAIVCTFWSSSFFLKGDVFASITKQLNFFFKTNDLSKYNVVLCLISFFSMCEMRVRKRIIDKKVLFLGICQKLKVHPPFSDIDVICLLNFCFRLIKSVLICFHS